VTLVIVNPSSGRGRGQALLPPIVEAFDLLGVEADVKVSTDATHLRTLVAQARDAGAERVAIVGGDGTLHAAVAELAGSTTAMAVIPTGTGDDNARALGIPLDDVSGAVRVVVEGSVQAVDLGEVTCDGSSEYFLGVLSTGFDSLVNERANTMAWPTGKARYLAAIVAELRTFSAVPYRASIDGRAVIGNAMLVAIGNGASYGGGMRICPDADQRDGLLNVTWLGGVPVPTFLRVFPSVFTGKHVESPYVATATARSVVLDAPGQLAYADGERVGPLPIEVTIRPGLLQVVVPGTAA